MRRFPPPGPTLGPTGTTARRRRPQNSSIWYYSLLKRATPLLLLLLGALVVLNYASLLSGDVTLGLGTDWRRSGDAHNHAAQTVATKRRTPLPPGENFENAPVYGFVLFSSYRTGPKTFATIGLSGTALREVKQLGRCSWKERGGDHKTDGRMEVFYPGEHHDLRYEAIIIHCALSEHTHKDKGGELMLNVDGTDVLVYTEAAGAFPVAEPLPPYKYQLAFCAPPIDKPVNLKRLHEWIEYHLYQGVDYMVFYDAGGIDEEAMAMLEAYETLKLLEVVDTRQVLKYESWLYGTLMLINDCAYRMRYSAKWALFADFNEYFDSESGITLSTLLDNSTGKPYVTLGSQWWSVEKCVPPAKDELEKGKDTDNSKLEEPWAIQKMLYHWPHIFCNNKEEYPRWELCLDYYGYRKYAADPRQVVALQIHRPEVPRDGGVDIDTDVARLNRWNGLVEKVKGVDNKTCSHLVNETEVVDWWVKDKAVAEVALYVRQKPVAKFKGSLAQTANATLKPI
eukprot:TRINITY_DN19336_c0_g1_i1.p1 TRINITY_DN19336_c0_g1~~TRINITY_DN19336_c0_g1_i1.p1  ORF type:complete len:510 (+),score=35.98 TRINITY_DN19336_c0_g1_i1:201-1730(+)